MDLVGVHEAALILGWDPRKLSVYYRRGKLPVPVARLAATPVWLRMDIEAYAKGERETAGIFDEPSIDEEFPVLVAAINRITLDEAARILGLPEQNGVPVLQNLKKYRDYQLDMTTDPDKRSLIQKAWEVAEQARQDSLHEL